MRSLIMTAAAVLLISSALSAAPIVGHYESASLEGSVLDGRSSDGFAGGFPPNPGDENQAASWDGSTLGTQWELTGAVLDTITLVYDIPLSSGARTVGYDISYVDAVLTLTDGGPWDGDAGTVDYTANLTEYSMLLQIWYDSNDVITEATASISFEGDFASFGGYRITDGSASGVLRGMGTTPPADYPVWDSQFPAGAWGVVNNIRFDIVPEPATLALLGFGAVAVLGRRKNRS